MHTLGFYHEQTRADRTQYVSIENDNVVPGTEENFSQKLWWQNNITRTRDYDYDSLMHSSRNSFAIDSSMPTITALGNKYRNFGSTRLSDLDIYGVNMLYGCKNVPVVRKCPDGYDEVKGNCN